MYYRLKDDYALRGWEKMSGVLVKENGAEMRPLNQREFSLLMLCDGVSAFEGYPLCEEEWAMLGEFTKDQVIEALTEPRQLDEKQQYRYFHNRFVESCFWSMTGRCNYHCRHCFMDAPDGMMGELSHEDAIRLIDQMAECGVMRVELTGGEPFVRNDFWQLVDHMRERAITVRMVYTNGLLLTDKALDAFEQRGMKPEFSISFDGLGWHDWMRGVNGAEKVALDALERCIRRGFPVNVEMCLHRGSVSAMRKTISHLAEMGVPGIKCSGSLDSPLWLKNCEGYHMDFPDYVEEMLKYIPQFYEDGAPTNVVLCDVVILRKQSASYEVVAEKYAGADNCMDCHLCTSARMSCYIAPDGRLLPCMPMTMCKEQEKFARFQDVGLRESLSTGFYMQFLDKRIRDLAAENEKCRACEHLPVCGGGCRAAALQQSGELMGADQHQCFLWENGYVARIHQAADAAIAKYAGNWEETVHEA